MNVKTKILFIHHGTGIGGAPISLLNLVKNLNRDKYDIKVTFIKGGVAEQMFRENGIATEVIGASNFWFAHNETGKIQWKYFYRYLKTYWHWRDTAYRVAPKYFATQDFDIVHLNSHVLTSWAVAAKAAGKRVVMHNREAVARGYFGVRYSLLKKLILKNCDAVINISEDNRRRLGIESKTSVVYNFVKIPETYRECMAEKGRARRVLYLGGMASIKGFEVTAKCLPFLDQNIIIQFAGSMGTVNKGPSLRSKLKYWAKILFYGRTYKPLLEIQRAENAEMLGVLRDPLTAIDACDILITPFTIAHFSRPAIEAFAYGKPVVGSDVQGMDEIIDHGVNGLLVRRDDPKSLAAAINYLCEHPEMARAMGEKGRQKAVEMFSPQRNTLMVEHIYDKLMSGEGE